MARETSRRTTARAPPLRLRHKETSVRNETARSDVRGDSDLAKWWMAIAGISLLAAGLLGFIDNPLVGRSANALFATDNVHNIVHILTGAIALYIGFGLDGDTRAN